MWWPALAAHGDGLGAFGVGVVVCVGCARGRVVCMKGGLLLGDQDPASV